MFEKFLFNIASIRLALDDATVSWVEDLNSQLTMIARSYVFWTNGFDNKFPVSSVIADRGTFEKLSALAKAYTLFFWSDQTHFVCADDVNLLIYDKYLHRNFHAKVCFLNLIFAP